MMHGHGKSHSLIVLTKLPNKAACAAAEAVEERGLAKGKTLERQTASESLRTHNDDGRTREVAQFHSTLTCPGHRAGNTCPARLSGYVRQPAGEGVIGVIILIL